MPVHPEHRVITAHALPPPRPFQTFAVRSDEPLHAYEARAPYPCVHLVRTRFLHAAALAGLAADGHARMDLEGFSDIAHASPTQAELAALTPDVPDLPTHIALALQTTGVLGDDSLGYQRSAATRVDYLGTCGAGFHNDVNRHWSRCLFWVLALDVADVEFVMPHAGVRQVLAPGDLLVFDQTMAHGLCRPADQGQAVASSFDGSVLSQQLFLTGELLLDDAQWMALGAPWLPVEVHAARGALDLMVAEFDPRTGAVKRPTTLRDGMLRSTCHAGAPVGSEPAGRLDSQATKPTMAATRRNDQ